MNRNKRKQNIFHILKNTLSLDKTIKKEAGDDDYHSPPITFYEKTGVDVCGIYNVS